MGIHRSLKTGRCITAQDLAREFEVHVRTIYRDIDFLRDRLKAPVQARGALGYCYSDAGYSLPDLTLTEGELLAFLVAERVVEGYAGSGAPFIHRMREGLQKLSQGLGQQVTVAMDDLYQGRYHFDAGPLRQVDPEVLAALHRALAERRTLEIAYEAIHGEGTSRRVVEPYHLLNHRGDWYVVARCRLRRDLRTFSVSRIRGFQEGSESYRIPADFDAEAYFQGALSIFRGGEPQEVRIWFSPRAARWVLERTWHPSQRIEQEPDGSAVLSMTVAPTVEVRNWILGHGSHARVLSPPGLLQEVHQEAEAKVALYREG